MFELTQEAAREKAAIAIASLASTFGTVAFTLALFAAQGPMV